MILRGSQNAASILCSNRLGLTSTSLGPHNEEYLERRASEEKVDDYLDSLPRLRSSGKRTDSVAKVRKLLDDKDLDNISKSSKKFRKEFRLS